MNTSITIDEMRPKLTTEADFRAILAQHEPVGSTVTPAEGTRVTLKDDWNLGLHDSDSTEEGAATLVLKNGTEMDFRNPSAVYDLTSLIGIPKAYVKKTPANLILPHINYWLGANGEREVRLLTAGEDILGCTKEKIVPFSNLELLDTLQGRVDEFYGRDTEMLFDYKSHHAIDATRMRIILPGHTSDVRTDDGWAVGLSLDNSLVGDIATNVRGYMFRWVCTNGMIATRLTSGNWSRRHTDNSGLMGWLATSIDSILGGFDHEFEMLDEAARTPIEGEVSEYMANVFRQYQVPLAPRPAIVENMVNSDDLTVYGVMQAITAAANEAAPAVADRLMAIGGDLPHLATCRECHRPITV